MSEPTPPMTDDIVERVSDAVHTNWMTAKRAAGVESRKLESGEELMVPYTELSEQAKDLDRGTVQTVLGVLPSVGYELRAALAGGPSPEVGALLDRLMHETQLVEDAADASDGRGFATALNRRDATRKEVDRALASLEARVAEAEHMREVARRLAVRHIDPDAWHELRIWALARPAALHPTGDTTPAGETGE